MLGAITFFSTTYLFSPLLNFLIFLVILFRCYKLKMHKINISNQQLLALGLIFVAAFISVINFMFVGPYSVEMDKSIIGAFPYIALILLSIGCAFFVVERDIKWLIVLIVFEVAIGLAELLYGVRSFFVPAIGETQLGDTSLLYYNRVFGLSLNSSVLAFKVLVLYVIWSLKILDMKSNVYTLLGGVLVTGLLITFSRTVIATVVCSFLIVNYKKIFKKKVFLIIILVIGLAALLNADAILEQLFRGKESDSSGRDLVFSHYLSMISDFPVFGNGSVKLWYSYSGGLFHAHNSYLQLVASNGLVISCIFLSGYMLFFKGYYIKILLPFFLYSVLQYGVWWGFVFNDIILFSLLFLMQRRGT